MDCLICGSNLCNWFRYFLYCNLSTGISNFITILVTVKENATYNTWTTIISTQEMAEKFSYLLSSSVMAKEVADNLNFDTLQE